MAGEIRNSMWDWQRSGSVSSVEPSEPSLSRSVSVLDRPVREVFLSPFAWWPYWVSLALFLYSLGWSDLFPPPESATVVLLLVSSLLFAMLAMIVVVPQPRTSARPISRMTIVLIAFYFLLAFVYSGGIPLFLIVSGAQYDIYSFGLPGVHVAMLSYTGYISIRSFHRYLVASDRTARTAFLVSAALLVLIGSRSAVMFLVFSSAYLYLRHRRPRLRRVAGLSVLTLLVLLAFGWFGNARLSQQINESTGRRGDSDAIQVLSRSNERFASTGLPPGSLWPYMYLASPVANLNNAVEQNRGGLCSEPCELDSVVLRELIPDVVGDRAADALGMPKLDREKFLISPSLTASTTFGVAVAYAGVSGGIIMMAALVALSLACLYGLKSTATGEVAVVVVASLLFFSSFENMIAYSPASLQLFWCVVFRRSSSRFA